jgi:hypothetical protein
MTAPSRLISIDEAADRLGITWAAVVVMGHLGPPVIDTPDGAHVDEADLAAYCATHDIEIDGDLLTVHSRSPWPLRAAVAAWTSTAVLLFTAAAWTYSLI